MARVQYSALVNRIYGKLGNFIYQTYMGTDYIRTSPCVWTNPNTYRQQQIRANLSQMNQAWDSVPPSHQELWQMFASMKGCHYFGHQAYVSLNCNLLNASHADLTCISHPPLRPGTPEHVQGFCVFVMSNTSVCLSWTHPYSNILYVTGHYRLHHGFCTNHPTYLLCTTTGYRPSFRFIDTARSDLKVMVHNHNYPSNTRLFYKLNSIDKFGRKSPISHCIMTRSPTYAGYTKRIKVTADHTKIDSSLSHFPLTIFLKSGNGETTKVFDEIGAQYLKMLITKDDGITPLYVEVEKWDNGSQIGLLHCGISGDVLSNSADTDYYIYYDVTQPDNTTYIGLTDSAPGHNVWDIYFETVQHMVDYDSSNIRDSTSHDTHGTKLGPNNPNEVAGKVAEAQDFNGSTSHITLGANTFDFLVNNSYTIEFIFNADSLAAGSDYERIIDLEGRIAYIESNDAQSAWNFGFYNGATLQEVTNNTLYTTGQYIYFSCDWDKPNDLLHFYINGGNVQSTSCSGTPDNSQNRHNVIGSAYDRNTKESDGKIDEIRISSVLRGSAWVKATYNSLWDTLLTYGNEEILS